jgi:hypothetical protein
MKPFGGKRNPSDIAAFSLQSGMTLKKLQEFARKAGAPIEKAELSAIKDVRRTLKRQRSVALGF